jgi:hypothetical protein
VTQSTEVSDLRQPASPPRAAFSAAAVLLAGLALLAMGCQQILGIGDRRLGQPDAATDAAVNPDGAINPDAATDAAVDPDAATDAAVDPDAATDAAADPDAATDAAVQPEAGSTFGWARWEMPACPDPGSGACAIYTTTNETVFDTKTGLTWQRSPSAGTIPWADAKAYCQGLVTDGGISGWRLPSRIELVSIVHYGRYNPAIDPVAFPSTPGVIFWSSSPYALNPSLAWGVYFDSGRVTGWDTYMGARVRCVQ